MLSKKADMCLIRYVKYNKLVVTAVVISILALTGCNKVEVESTGGFWLKMGDNSIVATSDIDFYDVSTHMIYLKKALPYLKKVEKNYGGIMSVYVDDEEIYKCSFHSRIRSYLPNGEYISCNPSFYPEDVICINFLQIIDLAGNPRFTDHRSDERIIAALKKNHLYHEGLRCEIRSVDVLNEKLVLNIELYNPDTFDYYHLDPDKMGIGLFHYFTNGLYFRNDQYQSFNHQETVIHPEPWNSWKKEWLALIKSGERKNISITYRHFEAIPAGKYKMSFCFPGISWTSQKNRMLNGGRIWMGDICTEKDITIY